MYSNLSIIMPRRGVISSSCSEPEEGLGRGAGVLLHHSELDDRPTLEDIDWFGGRYAAARRGSSPAAATAPAAARTAAAVAGPAGPGAGACPLSSGHGPLVVSIAAASTEDAAACADLQGPPGASSASPQLSLLSLPQSIAALGGQPQVLKTTSPTGVGGITSQFRGVTRHKRCVDVCVVSCTARNSVLMPRGASLSFI